jgi:hypothetical protein
VVEPPRLAGIIRGLRLQPFGPHLLSLIKGEFERGSKAETPPDERYTPASSTIKATEVAVVKILEAQSLFTVDMAEGTNVNTDE